MAKDKTPKPETPTVEKIPVTNPVPEVETSTDTPTVEDAPVVDPVPEVETSTDTPTVEEAPVIDPVPEVETSDKLPQPMSNREAARLLREKHQG